jgi:hypothetical protein
MRKLIYFSILAVLLLLVPVTVLQKTPLDFVLKNPALTARFVQRILGLSLFVLLFEQLLIGAFMDKFKKRLGEWVFNYHLIEGGIIYSLVILHTLAFMFYNHFAGSGWNPYLIYIDVCLICRYPLNYFYNLGRIAFWFLTITVFAGVFRKYNPWMKKNWRKLHVINYAVFLIVGAHGFLIGTDFRRLPFFAFAIAAYAIVVGVIAFIELPRLYKNYLSWVRS